MLRCACGRRLIIERTSRHLILRCPKHGIVLRYHPQPNSTAPPPRRPNPNG